MKEEIGKLDRAVAAFPRLKLAELPTPVTRLSRLSDHLGREIYCKRDDLTGFALGGNKCRKLEFLLANARQASVDTVVAVGGIQSNFCRVAAAAAAAADLDCFLVLGGRIPKVPSGNLILNAILGAEIELCASDSWADWEATAERLASDLRREGRNVYLMPIGGSTAVGALGYVVAAAEIARDGRRLQTQFDHIMFASSSGGTHAGLLVGIKMANMHTNLISISVAANKATLANEVFSLAKSTAKLVGSSVKPRDVQVDDRYIGEGYALPTRAGLEAIELFARLEGLFLDRVYTGKAASALIDYLEQGMIGQGETILFLHTGGSVELFAQYGER